MSRKIIYQPISKLISELDRVKTLYYPAAGGDKETVETMILLFQGLQRVLLADLGYTKTSFKGVYYVKSSGMWAQFRRDYSVVSEHHASLLNGDRWDIVETRDKTTGRNLQFEFISGDLFHSQVPFEDNPAVHIIHCPGGMGHRC